MEGSRTPLRGGDGVGKTMVARPNDFFVKTLRGSDRGYRPYQLNSDLFFFSSSVRMLSTWQTAGMEGFDQKC